MSESVLPADSEELGDLVSSGEMTTQQINEFIEKHAHYVSECDDICGEIIDLFDEYPLQLLLEHNVKIMTNEQCALVHEQLEDHIVPQDQGTRANVASAKLRLSVGRGLFSFVAEDLEQWLDEEYIDKTFSDEEILQSVRDYIIELTSFDICDEDTLESFISAYHNPGNWRDGGPNCDGDFEACDDCQEMLSEAVSKLK